MRLWPPPYSSFSSAVAPPISPSPAWTRVRDGFAIRAMSRTPWRNFPWQRRARGDCAPNTSNTGDDLLLQQQAEVVSEIRNSAAAIQRLTADNTQQQANCAKACGSEGAAALLCSIRPSTSRKRGSRPLRTKPRSAARAWLRPMKPTNSCSTCTMPKTNCWASARRELSRFTMVTAEILLTSLFLALVLFTRSPPPADGSGGGALASRTRTAGAERQGC